MQVEDTIVQEIQAGVTAGQLPLLAGIPVEALAAQVDVENDQLNVSGPSLLVAVTRGDLTQGLVNGDPITVAFVMVDNTADQALRRTQSWDILRQLADWLRLTAPEHDWEPQSIETVRLHPYAVVIMLALTVR